MTSSKLPFKPPATGLSRHGCRRGLRWLSPGLVLVLALASMGPVVAARAPQTRTELAQTVSAQGQAVSQGPPTPGGQRPAGPPMEGPGLRPEWKWWQDEAVKKELALTELQAAKIDRMYENRVKEVDPFVQEFVKQRAELERMVGERVVDATTIALQVGRVQTPAAKLFESRTVMLYRMTLILTADQHEKLKVINERHKNGRRGGGPPL